MAVTATKVAAHSNQIPTCGRGGGVKWGADWVTGHGSPHGAVGRECPIEINPAG